MEKEAQQEPAAVVTYQLDGITFTVEREFQLNGNTILANLLAALMPDTVTNAR